MKIFLFIIFPCCLKGQIITTIAGTGSSTFSGENVPAILAGLPNPGSGAFDKFGNYYIVDGINSHRVRKITPSGIISTAAGNGMGGYFGDNGPATSARLNGPTGVALDTFGNLYIADGQNHRIRKVDATTGIISTIAGTGIGGYNGDGLQATSAQIWGPADICIDYLGNIFIADGVNSRIRKINTYGIITTYAGSSVSGYSGDFGLATNANLGLPSGVATDYSSNLYIADNSTISNCVRKVNTLGIITTIAGNGTANYIGDGMLATMSQLCPNKIRIDNFNNIFISDRYNNRVYELQFATGILHNIIGNGVADDSGDGGLAITASLNYPSGVAIDTCGNLYIPTVGNVSIVGSGRRIRKITFNPPCHPLDVFLINTEENSFSIYPNPANQTLTISAVNNINAINVTNVVGQTVIYQQYNSKEKVELDIRYLPVGVYFVKVNGVYMQRVVKE